MRNISKSICFPFEVALNVVPRSVAAIIFRFCGAATRRPVAGTHEHHILDAVELLIECGIDVCRFQRIVYVD